MVATFTVHKINNSTHNIAHTEHIAIIQAYTVNVKQLTDDKQLTGNDICCLQRC